MSSRLSSFSGAARLRFIQQQLLREFGLWGYEEVSAPLLQQLEPKQLTSKQWELACKWFGPAGRLYALRMDMTSSILQTLALQQGSCSPSRLCYAGSVVRQAATVGEPVTEFAQAGVELIGYSGVWSEAEVLVLAACSLRSLGISDLRIGIGQAGFQRGLFAELGLDAAIAGRLQRALAARDLVKYRQLVAAFSDHVRPTLSALPEMIGDIDVLQRASALVQGTETIGSLQNLRDIHRLLASHQLEHLIYFDLGMVRDFSYYSGSVFEAFLPGLGRPVLTGGRYDSLLEAVGLRGSATGFAINLDLVQSFSEAAKSRSGEGFRLLALPGQELECFRLAEALRRKGLPASVDYRPETLRERALDAELSGQTPLLVESGDCWRLSKEGEKLCQFQMG